MAVAVDSNGRVTAPMNVLASVGAGVAVLTKPYRNLWVQVTGTFSATLAIEASLDGENYIVIASVAAASLVEVPVPAAYVRINTTAFTSGAPAATLIGKAP